MKTYSFIVTLLLLLALLGLYIQFDMLQDKTTASEAMKSVLTVEIEQLRERIKVHHLAIEAGNKKKIADSLRWNARDSVTTRKNGLLIGQISVLKKQRQEAGIIPDTLTNRIEVKYDSLVASKDQQIDSLKHDKVVLYEDFRNQVVNYEGIISAKDSIGSNLNTLLGMEQKKVKGLKNKNRLLKIGIGVASGLLVYQAIKN